MTVRPGTTRCSATLCLALWIAVAPLPAASTEGAGKTSERAPEQASVAFFPDHRRLELSATALPAEPHEWQIETSGLSEVETGADVGEPGIIYLPPPPGQTANQTDHAENVFFFHDLIGSEGWDLVVEFPANTRGTWKLNGRFSPLGGEVTTRVVIPTRELEAGENLLHLETQPIAVPSMRYRRAIDSGGARSAAVLTVGHANWSGLIRLVRQEPSGAGVIVSEHPVVGGKGTREVRAIPERWWEDRGPVREAALAVGRNLLRSQITRPGSRFEGGFNLVYDPSKRAHRMPHWIWAWGPSIHLLLELEQLPEARTAGLAPRFRAAAIAAGERTLAFECRQPGHPAQGLSTVRWEPSRATPNGWAEYLSTADSLFMAGWGWMSLHHATGERVYLERMQNLVTAAERLMGQYPVIPQDWIVERQRWTPHTLDESVFGTIGFRRLHETTRAPETAAAGRRFLDSHLRHMSRGSGLLMRGWMRDENKEIWDPDIKGHGWVMEGYLDAHRLSGDPRYLELALQLARRVLECQAGDGSWTYLFKQPAAGDPIDDKGTAIWAYLLYDLYKTSGDPQHLAAARRALGWCLAQQYRGTDEFLDGAILHENNMAYVRRRPMTILYTTTFFGLALLEELALPETSRSGS